MSPYFFSSTERKGNFSLIICRYCSKWRLKIKKKMKKVASTPHFLTSTAYPTPGKVVSQFFHQNKCKACEKAYLYSLDHHFLKRFGTTRETTEGASPPAIQKRLNLYILFAFLYVVVVVLFCFLIVCSVLFCFVSYVCY